MKYSNNGKPYLLWFLAIASMWSSLTYGQSASFGDIFIPADGVVAVHDVDHSFLVGSTSIQPGKIVTERNGLKGYFGFVGTSTWSGANDNRHVDGYVRTYKVGSFTFPIGHRNIYRPAAVKSASPTQPADAAYYFLNPSTLGTAKASSIKSVSNSEYWDINGSLSTPIVLSWSAVSGVASLTSSNLSSLTIVGWNGLEWLEIPSVIDAASISGGTSTLASGSITSVSIIPNTFEFYTLASKVIPIISKDTSIIVKDTNRIALGIDANADTNTRYSLSGPFNGSGIATINPSSGLIDFKPSNPSFVGRDTIYRIRCVTNGAITVCDTSRIFIVGQPDRSKPVLDSTDFNRGKVLADLPPISTGGKPFTLSTSSSAGSIVTVGANGKVNYTPKAGFSGSDTVRIIRCVGDICDIVTYIIVVKASTLADIPNYFSPNGDGINDVWDLDLLLDAYPNSRVIIYNRWGNIVWRSIGPYGRTTSGSNIWYGQLEGKQDNVPDGVYYYLLELDNEFKTSKTGFIELMRQ